MYIKTLPIIMPDAQLLSDVAPVWSRNFNVEDFQMCHRLIPRRHHVSGNGPPDDYHLSSFVRGDQYHAVRFLLVPGVAVSFLVLSVGSKG